MSEAGAPERPAELDRSGIPLSTLDPAIIHRVRALNASALRVIDGMLDQIADRGGRL